MTLPTNLPALREIGFQANRRLLDVQQLSHDPIIGASAFTAATAPVHTPSGERIPGLRFADPRVHALLAALWPGSPGTLLCQGPFRTVHAHSYAHGSSKP